MRATVIDSNIDTFHTAAVRALVSIFFCMNGTADDILNPILPEGYGFVATGQAKPVSDAFSSMVMTLTIAVLFIFFVLAAQFESYIDPLAITMPKDLEPKS